MSAAKKPGGLLDQYKLLSSVIRSKEWATLSDVETADVIIERYFPKHSNSRVSLTYLEQATGGKRERIVASIRKLLDHGVIGIVRKGRGTRPTEFSLNFDYSPNSLVVPKMGTTTGSELVVPKMGTTVVPKMGTQTYLEQYPRRGYAAAGGGLDALPGGVAAGPEWRRLRGTVGRLWRPNETRRCQGRV